MKKAIFYFDGFNFYNGLRDKSSIDPVWKKYYWLDLVKFCNQFLDPLTHELVCVKYFTAPPSSNEKRSRQSAFFKANKIINGNKIEIINGIYQVKKIQCGATCKKTFDYPEEKRTDVSISTTMLLDCFLDKVDLLILISADSDQIPTLEVIKTHFPKKKAKVYFPPERTSADILSKFKPVVYLGGNEDKFKISIMLKEIKDETTSKIYTCPDSWK